MGDFLVYVVFLVTGMTVAAFFGWMFMRWAWQKDRADARGFLAIILAAIFGASS